MPEDAKVYNPTTAKWEKAGADDKFRVAEHEAMIAGKEPPQSDDPLAAMPAPVRSNALGQADAGAEPVVANAGATGPKGR